MAITIGAAAIDRSTYLISGYTAIVEENPASEAFTILKVKIHAAIAMTGVKVATFYKTDGDTFSTRNTELIGDVPLGYSEHEVSIGAEAGDYIGVAFTGGQLDMATTGGTGLWETSGDYIPCSEQAFTHRATWIISLGGDSEIPLVVTITETEVKPTYFGEGGGGWNVFAETELSPLLPAPEVTTDPALWIGPLSATLDGTLDSGGGIEPCDCGFEWGETDAYGETTPTERKETGESFSQLITGLLPGTTYHFRALATNVMGTSHGDDRTFVTAAAVVLPTVTTDPAIALSTTAIPNGTLNQDGGEACQCGFEYGETEEYGTTTPSQSRTTGQTFSQVIDRLFSNTTYHFRAFATNAAGTSYGADRTFTTLATISAAVTTDEATNVRETSATPNGTLDEDGGEACEVRFQYGLTTDYGTNTAWQPGKTTEDAFSQLIVELVGGKLYHFRAQARNSTGTVNGADRTLATITPLVVSRAYALSRKEL